jgi:chromosome partitioning protein
MPKIITVAAAKGGVGKTTLAYELAYELDAPLVDLDWDAGGATRKWGYRHETHVRSALLDALESGRPPALLSGHGRRPDLLPGHPDFAARQPEAEQMAAVLEKWAAAWGRPYVVVDTHPGAAHAGHGAMLAASVVVVPVILGTNELNATEGLLTEVGDYPLLLVPNRIPRTIPGPELRRLRRLVEGAEVPVGPVVPFCRPLETRKRRAAVTAEDPTPANVRDFVSAMGDVAAAVRAYVDAT